MARGRPKGTTRVDPAARLIWEACERKAQSALIEQSQQYVDKRLAHSGFRFYADPDDGGHQIFKRVPPKGRAAVVEYGIDRPNATIPQNLDVDTEHAILVLRDNRVKRNIPAGQSGGAPALTTPPKQLANGQRQAIIKWAAQAFDVPEARVRTIWRKRTA